MKVSMVFLVLMSLAATVLGGTQGVYKRGLAHYDYDSYNFDGHNSLEDYSHYSHYAHSLPAYSTVSYVMSNGHHKPVSYSGFTNHGRGHHDPGYSVQYRSEGFGHSDDDHHYHHSYY
ncbi:hypothetical protein RUM44_008458 [Polyplax serrata]|uniref:Uncharacterized protein n=1 Tax=Polyplax serrata TaxID=468196 RepID=A0ABR1BA79_POLSC